MFYKIKIIIFFCPGKEEQEGEKTEEDRREGRFDARRREGQTWKGRKKTIDEGCQEGR